MFRSGRINAFAYLGYANFDQTVKIMSVLTNLPQKISKMISPIKHILSNLSNTKIWISDIEECVRKHRKNPRKSAEEVIKLVQAGYEHEQDKQKKKKKVA